MLKPRFVVVVFVLLGVVLGVLAGTNPSQEAHKKVVHTAVAADVIQSPMLSKLAVDLLGDTNVIPLEYHNYYLWSTTTLRGERYTFGMLSKVWLCR